MKVQVHTRLKEGVLDPQGKAVESALKNLGYKDIKKIRQGKLFDIDIDTTDPSKAKEKLGWTPEVTFEGLAKMMFEADLEHFKKQIGEK